MPGKNLTRVFVSESHYHLYNRGINKARIFLDAEDYTYFERLLRRHLSSETQTDALGRQYKSLSDEVQLEAYCLMPNHFHLLVYQQVEHGIVDLMMSIATAYTMYFNRKYERRGPLYESTYRASLIDEDAYLEHISRYIHLNPKQYKSWPYSSYQAYLATENVDWLHPERILAMFSSKREYRQFVNEYESAKEAIDLIKHELADNF